MLKNNPLVSIVIPTYNDNNKDYLLEAIESALNQTYKNIEVILIDDGSTDNTKDVLKDYIEQEKIKYIYQPNKERSCARNRGIAEAKGEYIVFLDADDIILPQYIEKGIDAFLKKSEDNIVFSNASFFYDNNKGNIYKENLPDLETYPAKILLVNNYFSIHTIMFQKKLFFNTLFDESLNIITCEDWDVLIRLSLDGACFRYIDDHLSFTRIHSKNTSSDRNQLWKIGLMVMNKTIKVLENSVRNDKIILLSLAYIGKAKQELLIDEIDSARISAITAIKYSKKNIILKLITLTRAILSKITIIKKLDKKRIKRKDYHFRERYGR